MNYINQSFNDKWENILPKIPSRSIDLVYTDPPYGIDYVTNIPGDKHWNKDGKTSSKFDKILNDADINEVNWGLLSRELFRVLKKNTFCFMHLHPTTIMSCGICFANAGFKYKGMIAWNKNFAIGGDLYGTMKRDWEPILYLAKGKPKLKPVEVLRGDEYVLRTRISEIQDWIFSLPTSEKTGFPTQKPSKLCEQVIELSTSKNDLVCDPFAGSFVIPRVAKALDRQYLAIEADSSVFDKFNL